MTWHKGKLCIEHYSTAIWNFFDEKASKNKLYSTPKMAHRINNIVEEFQTFEIGSESTVYDQSNTGCQFAITLYLKNSILLLPPFVSTSLRPLSWFWNNSYFNWNYFQDKSNHRTWEMSFEMVINQNFNRIIYIRRKWKDGSKLKSLPFQWTDASTCSWYARGWILNPYNLK